LIWELLAVLALLAAAVWVLAGPLRAGWAERQTGGRSAEEGELEAAREAKYAEIREAELDFRTGKLSEEDWRAIDRALRAEAIAILRRLDRVRGESPPG
jgi:hypothetical protein